ncbi:hypothetical protein [Vibrio phage LV6]|nr:hypothetical protein [Vibrio phage LV6]
MALTIKHKVKKSVPVVTAKTTPKAKILVTETETDEHGHETETVLREEEHETPLTGIETNKPLCNVGYSSGITRNLGDYNSLKVSVSLHIPCEFENIHNAFKFAHQFVDEKVNLVLEDYE